MKNFIGKLIIISALVWAGYSLLDVTSVAVASRTSNIDSTVLQATK